MAFSTSGTIIFMGLSIMAGKKTGVYLIGALGSISATVVSGALALKKQLVPTTGIITCSEIFQKVDLVDLGNLYFSGCDIRKGTCPGDIYERMVPVHPRIIMEIQEELWAFQSGIDAGCARNCGEAIERLAEPLYMEEEPLAASLDRIRGNLRRFREKFSLDETVVVNLASTEPPITLQSCHSDPQALQDCVAENRKEQLRASTLYALAAVLERLPYINFTPSNGALPPAVIQLAQMNGVPVMGNDGKTGETLVKSILAPMFAWRNLEVMSWEGFNILGNMDGQVLNHPGNRESKIRTKDHVLSKILGYSPHTSVNIGYVPSLDDQKTAWDFIHFRGFLGAKMSLQFIWQGYDSILAAPLVLDLVRLMELAKRRGEAGLMPHLACFFKAPIGVDKHALQDQFQLLTDYAEGLRGSPR